MAWASYTTLQLRRLEQEKNNECVSSGKATVACRHDNSYRIAEDRAEYEMKSVHVSIAGHPRSTPAKYFPDGRACYSLVRSKISHPECNCRTYCIWHRMQEFDGCRHRRSLRYGSDLASRPCQMEQSRRTDASPRARLPAFLQASYPPQRPCHSASELHPNRLP
ncbi:hypothetical protein BCV70DRAFT_79238 [Testicularia cyperi]|uniref:Uncharacterized protein n=1 Tax=Testicularia cyperi TaxID=1882483 RepID=A0A317XWQ3_9BASI|nr:hypothetical protein BCV70DRAFT_79238 [Testicularia cyperi]